MLPAYIANMAPVLFKNKLKFLAIPISPKHLGSHKTYRGFIVAVILGLIVFYIQKILFSVPFFNSISVFDYNMFLFWPGFLLSFGAIFGDSVKSFFKRRAKIKPGKPWPIFDQIDYSIGAIVFSMPVINYTVSFALTIIILSAILHVLSNHLGFYLGVRDVKW